MELRPRLWRRTVLSCTTSTMSGMICNSSGMICNSDLEFNSLKPCFYSEEDDTYFDVQNSTPPEEDIWKKFELLSTPRMSPDRALAEHSLKPVNWAREMLLPEVDLWNNPAEEEVLGLGGLRGCTSNLIILQDCMWSGFSTQEKLPEGYRSLATGPVTTASSAGHMRSGTGVEHEKAAALTELSQLDLECVDPDVVFPSYIYEPMPVPTIPTSTGAMMSLGDHLGFSTSLEDFLSNSGSVEEGGEEIYVAWVEETQFSKTVTGLPAVAHQENPALSPRYAQSSEQILKLCELIQELHNYAAPPLPYVDREDTRPQKKRRSRASRKSLKRVLQPKARRLGSRNNSNHNRMEHQRCDIIHSSFLDLRDLVPELVHNEKATKMAILKKATKYIHILQAYESKLLVEWKKLYERQQQLLEKIKQSAVW
ncbi:protein S-Myc-like [Apodemus sylvaticus]|uniref:protein S-Myc-like n=1 Tax=Apodemus sylvaticus TaxID=10129 RepID=UPI0022441E47|nr:protein S-Myc-like [Apodemus sylvaticus]